MKKAIWFSRHQPTAKQIEDAGNNGWQLVSIDEGIELGNVNIQDDADLDEVAVKLYSLALNSGAGVVVGVWSAPMLELMERSGHYCNDNNLLCYTSWNVSRSQEGGKPTFEHKRYCFVGKLNPKLFM